MTVATELRPQIESANRQFMAAFKQGDVAAIAAMYTEAGQLLPPNSDFVSGREAIRAFWGNVRSLGIADARLETIEVEEHGDTAIEMGRFTLLAEDGSQLDGGKYLVIWKVEDGAVKLHRDIWSSSRPAA